MSLPTLFRRPKQQASACTSVNSGRVAKHLLCAGSVLGTGNTEGKRPPPFPCSDLRGSGLCLQGTEYSEPVT